MGGSPPFSPEHTFAAGCQGPGDERPFAGPLTGFFLQ